MRFSRSCEVVQIPAGEPVTVRAGTEGVVTQALGGAYTLQVEGVGSLVRLRGEDADAIGFEPTRTPEVGTSGGDLESQVWEQLRSCYDPEIPVNIVDLGLVYDLHVSENAVNVKMTLTAQGCGMGGAIAGDAEQKIRQLAGVNDAKVEIVWDPPWNPRMISPEGRKQLGID